ncbi:MAG TPA: 3-mercaptopyruvate sulfurtransferase [Magnetospirillum sp.]|jgi:thiosulfate/3-mercaptopyruvate sulfurtransferase|nr:3-mercaptopyruvate sulfurtransferase [Magnetospirillum sp.]
MSYPNPEALVSTEWLAAHLSAPDVRVVDATYFMPSAGRNAREEYENSHIPGAVYFDVDEIKDSSNPLPHMLPPPEKFASRVRKLGLGNGNKVVVYDTNGLGAARVWWMFRVFGHRDVAVLDGGLTKWMAEHRPTEDLPPMPRDRHFLPQVNATLVRNFAEVKANIDSKREQVVDARAAGRFNGTAPEPWPVKHVGHMPGALNVPFGDLIDETTKTMKPAAQLKARFDAAGVDFSKPVICSCGSGITACTVALALHLLGHNDVSVYDGSWAEWGNHADAVAVVG